MEDIKKFERYKNWAIYLIIVGVVIIVVFLFMMGFSGMLKKGNLNTEYTTMLGTFIGGSVGAIWALAGVLLFFAALMYQRKELEETIKVKNATIQAFNDQKEAYKLQTDLLEFSKFQTLFFGLYEIFNSIRNDLNTVTPHNHTVPMVVFSKKIKESMAPYHVSLLYNSDQLIDRLTSEMPAYINKFINFCETFYTLVYHSTHEKHRENENDKAYLKHESLIVRGLSEDEMLLIFYYGLHSNHSAHLREYFKTGPSWVWKMNQIKSSNRIFYDTWIAIKGVKDEALEQPPPA